MAIVKIQNIVLFFILFALKRPSNSFSLVAVPFYIFHQQCMSFCHLQTLMLSLSFILAILIYVYIHIYIVISHMWLYLDFPHSYWRWVSVQLFICHQYSFFVELFVFFFSCLFHVWVSFVALNSWVLQTCYK